MTNDPATSHDWPAASSDFIPSKASCCDRDTLSTRQSRAFSCESMATLASCTRRAALTGDTAVELMLDDGRTSPPTVDFSDELHGWGSADHDLNINNFCCKSKSNRLYSGADLHFFSLQLHTNLKCKTTDTKQCTAVCPFSPQLLLVLSMPMPTDGYP